MVGLAQDSGAQGSPSRQPTRQQPKHRGAHLVLIGLLLPADGHVAGAHVHVDLVVAGQAPAALRGRADPLELQLGVPAELPGLPRCGEHVHPPEEIHRPQRGAGHGGRCGEGRQGSAIPPAPGSQPRGTSRPGRAQEPPETASGHRQQMSAHPTNRRQSPDSTLGPVFVLCLPVPLIVGISSKHIKRYRGKKT